MLAVDQIIVTEILGFVEGNAENKKREQNNEYVDGCTYAIKKIGIKSYVEEITVMPSNHLLLKLHQVHSKQNNS